MATGTKDMRERRTSRRPAIYGTLAYRLDSEELESAGEELRHERTRGRAAVCSSARSDVAARRRARQRISPSAVLGVVLAAVLAVLLLMGQVRLTALSSEVVSLQRELAQLETDNITLTTQYEQLFDLSTVKEAAESAGMTKPSASQVFYIDMSEGDSAVVYQPAEPGVLGRLLTSLHHSIYTVVEYFH